MGKLDDRTAMVTGSARGIGRAIAERLASEGANLALVDVIEDALTESASACEAAGAKTVKTYTVDVTDADAVQALVKSVTSDFGGLDILVNNAGITRDNLLMRTKDDEWDAVLSVNLRGAFLLIRAATRPLMKSKNGRLVNIASVIGITGNAGQSNYAASKGGLIALTKSVAKEFASRKITANAIAPGLIATDMTKDLGEDVTADIMKRIPLGRYGQPEEIANAVAFFASDDAAYITGQVLVVDGGMVM